VQDSEGTRGVIVARSKAWLTMRTDAGEERHVRKVALKLIAPAADSTRKRHADHMEAEANDTSSKPAKAPESTAGKKTSSEHVKKNDACMHATAADPLEPLAPVMQNTPPEQVLVERALQGARMVEGLDMRDCTKTDTHQLMSAHDR
jgi:hypothetical protein